MKAIITVGISASGKSTWAREAIEESDALIVELNRDNYRRNILNEKGLTPNSESGVRWAKWNWKWEKEVTKRAQAGLDFAVRVGCDVIVSDTNLNEDRRVQLEKQLVELGYTVETKVFEVSFEEACRRDAARINGVGVSVIAKQLSQFNEQFGPKKYVADTSKPRAIIVDVDGTLAKMNGRGPFEWHKVDTDLCQEFVRDIVCGIKFGVGNTSVIVLSGRDGNVDCRHKTGRWLSDNFVPFDALFMREAGDSRKDAEIKEEIFWREIAPNYNVVMAIDDRPVMCRKWRELGLNLLQVGDQYVEF